MSLGAIDGSRFPVPDAIRGPRPTVLVRAGPSRLGLSWMPVPKTMSTLTMVAAHVAPACSGAYAASWTIAFSTACATTSSQSRVT